jgi:predicted LPLAT superfamily acyltransferase/GT2 family glycosyltransferase
MNAVATDFRPCAVIPTHNHWRSLRAIIARLQAENLPVFVIDDGSDAETRRALADLQSSSEGFELVRFEDNRGKGAAVMHGLALAAERGFTHALQLDADGQHDLAVLPEFLARARQRPDAVVTGQAAYDRSVPLGRKIGRWITHFWVWVETLSLRIPDTMCGFRIYPLAAVEKLSAQRIRIGARMEFDTEIAVRLFWGGAPYISIPVRVIYPPENSSNFRMLKDNLRISAMHTRLVFTLLFNLPKILANRPPVVETPRHWAWMMERGVYLGLLFCATAYRLLGRKACLVVLAPVVFYFYCTGSVQRRASRDFLRRAFARAGRARAPGFWNGYRHFFTFAARTLDTFIAWTGGTGAEMVFRGEVAALAEAEASPRGAIFVISHQGSADLARAALDDETRKRLTILVHTRHAQNYSRLLERFRPEAVVDMMQVSELGPEGAIALREKVDAGSWVVIAGDRIPLTGNRHVSRVPFLGEPAGFAQGPYVLAALLDCPVYALFCLREGPRYRLDVHKLADRIVLPRGDRAGALQNYTAAFARRLEDYALKDPYQWFNFFDFWAEHKAVPQS